MMMNTTLAQLRTLKLDGLAGPLEDQLTQPGMAALSFEERMALLVDREVLVYCRPLAMAAGRCWRHPGTLQELPGHRRLDLVAAVTNSTYQQKFR